MAVPVELHLLAAGRDDLVLHEAHERAHAVGRRVAHRVGETETSRAPADRVAVERLERFGRRARRVLGDEHHRQPFVHRERDRGLARAQEIIERPVFRVLADGRRADEGRALNGDAGRLRDPHDRLDVGARGARGAVGAERQLGGHDLAREGERVGHRARTGAGQPDVRTGDAERDHEVEQFLLALDVRIRDRRALQPIAQCLVVQLDAAGAPIECAGRGIPVVDEIAFLHWVGMYGRFGATATPRGPRRCRQCSRRREH